jgi:hypothetical protein
MPEGAEWEMGLRNLLEPTQWSSGTRSRAGARARARARVLTAVVVVVANVHTEERAESLPLAALSLGCRGTLRTRRRLSRGYRVMSPVLVPAPDRLAHAAGPGNTPLLGVAPRFGRRGLPCAREGRRPA